MNIYPVILCGGAGTRLWPASRTSRPKQFARLLGPLSLFQTTVLRLEAITGARSPVIVAGEAHIEAIREQLEAIGAKGVIIAEPARRDSAPAIAAAAAWIEAADPRGIAVAVASDHHIPDAPAFAAAARTAAEAADQGYIVTFGVRPTHAATGYGYIRPGPALAPGSPVAKVERFIEKPGPEAAQALVDEGALWNSGNFVFQAARLMNELAIHAPSVGEAARAALRDARTDGNAVRLGQAFLSAPEISIDYALMEKTDRAAVAPVDFDWSDVGAWEAVWAASEKDSAGNALSGDALAVDSQGCLVRADGGHLIVVAGLKGVGVIAENDTVLVCDLSTSQGVKQVVDQLVVAGRREATHHRQEEVTSVADAGLALEQWLFTAALPLWWALGADHARGGFHERIGMDGRAMEGLPRRARVQARQVHVYATAGVMGWGGPWRQAANHGLASLFARYRRPDGLYRFSVNPDGTPAEDRAMLYEQAFVLLALASASVGLPSRRKEIVTEAEALRERVLAWARHPAGGYRESAPDAPFQANAQMHLFEAALAWIEAGGGEAWTALADEIAGLALSRFIDSRTGGLRELYDADWGAALGVEGRVLEPGHQFEWAWLLHRWGVLRGRGQAAGAVERLYRTAAAGIDKQRGVAIDAMLDNLSPHRATARLWPQTEWIRAAVMQKEGEKGLRAAVSGLQQYLDTPVRGLWRDRLGEDGAFAEEAAPASSLYHIVGAIRALRGA